MTSLFVTHDLKEALIMGEQLAYMEEGKLTMYDDKKSFLSDARTGAMAEKAFWDSVA
jgi:ABC-type proline/glycine betaine transport system ATPase subunit